MPDERGNEIVTNRTNRRIDPPIPTGVGQIEGATPVANARIISIEPLNHGYVVTVGCQRFAIESSNKLVDLLSAYLQNPYEVEGAWMNKEVDSIFFPKM